MTVTTVKKNGKYYQVDSETGTETEVRQTGLGVVAPTGPTPSVDGQSSNPFNAQYSQDAAAIAAAQEKANRRSVPFSGIGDDQNDRVITLWTPNGYGSSGAIPSYMPQSASIGQLKSLFRGMTWNEKQNLKNRLWAGGFYQSVTGDAQSVIKTQSGQLITPPTSRYDWSDADEEALTNAVNTYINSNDTTPNRSFDSFIHQSVTKHESTSRQDVQDIYNVSALTNDLQNWADSNLGRNFTDKEVQEVLKMTLGFDTSVQHSDISSMAPAGIPQPGTSQNARYINGGGVDSSAIKLGNQLANTYQLQVLQGFTPDASTVGAPEEFTDAFHDGRALKITGDASKMLKFHEWARSQQGEGKLFENVRAMYETSGVYKPGKDEPTSIIISFNDGAEAPYLTAGNFGFDSADTDMNRFLNSVKRPGEFSAYRDWDGEGPNRRGAYGISDDKWEFYTSQLGIDSADHTPNSQDRVAAAWINDLWNKYKNWEDVGYAVRLDEAAADRRRDDKRVQGAGFVDQTPEADRNWVNEVFRRMPLWKPVISNQSGLDAYSSIYGSGYALPIDPFAEMPTNYESAKLKMENVLRKTKGFDMENEKLMMNVVKQLKTTSFVPGQEPWDRGK